MENSFRLVVEGNEEVIVETYKLPDTGDIEERVVGRIINSREFDILSGFNENQIIVDFQVPLKAVDVWSIMKKIKEEYPGLEWDSE